MRRIVLEQNDIISLNEISDRSFVGIEWERGQKCMIIRTTDGFCSISNDHYPNILNVWYADTVQEYVTRALNQGNNTNSKAFVFNNTKELCEWMSK